MRVKNDFILSFCKAYGWAFLYALGVVVTINADIGYSPWAIFHVGLSKTFDYSLGTISIAVGLIIGVFMIIMREEFGFGTVFNMFLVGFLCYSWG